MNAFNASNSQSLITYSKRANRAALNSSTSPTVLPPPPLTKVGALHEVVARVFGIGAGHAAGDGVELGELVAVETVVVVLPAQGRGAVGHVGPVAGLHLLGLGFVVEDLTAWWKRATVFTWTVTDQSFSR